MSLPRAISLLLSAISVVSLSPASAGAEAQHPAIAAHAEAAAQTPAPAPATPPAGTVAAPEAPKTKENPLPGDKSVAQTITLNGKVLHYTATVGSIEMRAGDGKPTGVVTYISYVMDTAAGQPHRPVTFALNGGPGASSVYLNLGALGPKHIAFGNEGDSPSDPAIATDNPATWLDFTDLVFLDPIGTGFSRSLVDENETKKLFYAPTPDVEYLSLSIYKWLVSHDRMLDKKYLVGESYGGYRGPRIAYYLQGQLGVALNGLVLVSPYLNPQLGDPNLSPIPWMTTLPSITAAHLEAQGKLTDAAMADAIAYTRGEYATTLLKGRSDPAATDAMLQRVTQMTGLDPTFVRYSGGRIDTQAYLREVHRSQGLLGSVYDSNVTGYDPFPFAPESDANDPILAAIVAPTTSAMVDFMVHTVGWKTDARYYALSYDVNRAWDRSSDLEKGSVPDLRQAVAADPKLRVLILHGWNDLSCPFMGSVLSVDQMPVMGEPGRVSVHEFPGGHMFYTRTANGAGMHALAEEMTRLH